MFRAVRGPAAPPAGGAPRVDAGAVGMSVWQLWRGAGAREIDRGMRHEP
jgi:hypothetical protein